jgi:hypothetical protein
LARKAQPAYDLIKRKLTSSNAGMIGSDETGIKVGGENHWAWVWQNQEATFISITDNRGQRSITQNFENGFEKAVLVMIAGKVISILRQHHTKFAWLTC